MFRRRLVKLFLLVASVLPCPAIALKCATLIANSEGKTMRIGMLVETSQGRVLFSNARYFHFGGHFALKRKLEKKLQPDETFHVVWAGEYELERAEDQVVISRINETSGMLSKEGIARPGMAQEVLPILRKVFGEKSTENTMAITFDESQPHLVTELNSKSYGGDSYLHRMRNLLTRISVTTSLPEASKAKLRDQFVEGVPEIEVFLQKIAEEMGGLNSHTAETMSSLIPKILGGIKAKDLSEALEEDINEFITLAQGDQAENVIEVVEMDVAQ